MEDPQTRGAPDAVQAPDDVGDPQAVDPRHGRASPSSTIVGAWVFIVLFGAWMVLSTVALDYGVDDSKANAVIVGALAIAIGVLGLMRVADRPLAYASIALGLWLMASAALVTETRDIRVNHVLMGGILVVLGIVALSAFSDRYRSGRSVT